MIRLKRLYINNFKQLQDLELRFPDRARILVQGKNEAGKSTLFEAIFFALFGSALATETGARGLDDLIRYEVEKALVELDLQFGNRLFKIKRTIVRGKTNTWELDVMRDGAIVEEIRGNTAVNKRLIGELGFDGDALLNTCFVEQKKLEKLEGLSKSKREESLAKLLNLDQLVQIESDLKVGAEDKREIDRLKKRADLAAIQSELPAFEQALAKTEEQLALIDLRGAVDGAVGEMRAVEKLDAEIQSLSAQRDLAAQRVERLDALKQAMLDVKAARDAAERANDNARDIERLKQEQADTQRTIAQIPEWQARIAALRRLGNSIRRLDQVRTARDAYSQRARQIAATETRAAELAATIAREEAALAQSEVRLREHEIDAALGDWIVAKRDAVPASDSQETVAAKRAARDQLAQRFRSEIFIWGGLALILGLATVIAPIAATAFAGYVTLAIVVIPVIVFIGLAVLTVIALVIRATSVWRNLTRVSEELGQVEGEARAKASASEAQTARLGEIESNLARQNVAIPESIFDALARRVTHPKSLDELRAEQAATRERLLNARAVLGELQKQNSLNGNAQDERARCERADQKADRILSAWQPRLQTAAQAIGVAADANAVQRAQYQLQAQIEQLQRRANDATRFAQEIARREQQAQSFLAQARDAHQKAIGVKPNATEWNPGLTIDNYTAFGKELRADYDALGGDAVVKQLRDIEGDLGRRQGERATRQKNAEVLLARVRDLFPSFPSVPSDSVKEIKELTEIRGKLQSLDLGDEATLRAQQRELVGRVRSLSDRQTQLERDLGLAGQSLDRATCQMEWEQKVRESLVRERGVEIASVARRRIVQKVLPATMDYMRQILPTLTRDRYHDAQLDPETYKIQVWDERAGTGGTFKEKNIFSGGTKDQFSLALRLAFALATLPQERGAAPSFIFLDEPLGSFDDERADALIYLLTEGEIARAFDQIFLISHVHVNERLFTHRVILENGRVAETDLPKE